MTGLFESLSEYKKNGRYPFHMPGHKRNPEFLKVADCDITEIEGFDDLHHAEGIIKECEERAAALYGGAETHILVNGSTCGIQAALAAAAAPGECVLAARNSHRALYNAAAVTGVKLEYIYPKIDDEYGLARGITADDAAEAIDICMLTGKKIKAVYITSPTYEGRVSDIEGIAAVCHAQGIPLIVDEAHGAHFGFDERLPKTSAGTADIVIHSIHKTLPALTQTALIHVSGDIIDRQRLRYMLTVFQSSSPSYILMASADSCMETMADKDRVRECCDRLFENIGRLKASLKGSGLRLLETDDPTRLLLAAESGAAAGPEIYKCLEENGVEPEMCTPFYTVLISTLCDTDEGFDLLIKACSQMKDREFGKASGTAGGFAEKTKSSSGYQDIDTGITRRAQQDFAHASRSTACSSDLRAVHPPEGFSHRRYEGISYEKIRLFEPGQALRMKKSVIPLEAAEGSVSGEYIYIYPPGIPLIVPGEIIDGKTVEEIKKLKDLSFDVRGMTGEGIPVVRMERD